VCADAGLYAAKAAGKNRILLPQGERRRHRRQAPATRVRLQAGEAAAEVAIKNASEGGLLVSLREPVAVGSAVRLQIERADREPFGLRGEVVRVERVPGQVEPAYDVGVRFVEPDSAARLLPAG
jgi:hypothetical protein